MLLIRLLCATWLVLLCLFISAMLLVSLGHARKRRSRLRLLREQAGQANCEPVTLTLDDGRVGALNVYADVV